MRYLSPKNALLNRFTSHPSAVPGKLQTEKIHRPSVSCYEGATTPARQPHAPQSHAPGLQQQCWYVPNQAVCRHMLYCKYIQVSKPSTYFPTSPRDMQHLSKFHCSTEARLLGRKSWNQVFGHASCFPRCQVISIFALETVLQFPRLGSHCWCLAANRRGERHSQKSYCRGLL